MEFLFGKGTSHNAYPVKLIWIETPVNLTFPAQALFVVPKRNFKRAHDRNKLKRRMREVYRLNKNTFYEELNTSNKKVILAFLYTGKKQEEYSTIETSVLKLLKTAFGAKKG
jgi:ribonuclease P protein component